MHLSLRLRLPFLLSLFIGSMVFCEVAGAQPYFTDATGSSDIRFRNVNGAPPGEKGWLMEGMGTGAGWLDYDGDGNLDLYLVNGSAFDRKPGQGEPNQLYRGDGKGKFVNVTEKAGVGDRGWGQGVAVGDFDNDGDDDLYVANIGPNALYRNKGDGTFEEVGAQAGVASALWSASAAFFDMDGDGDLDLYVGNYMEGHPDSVPRRGSKEADGTNVCVYKGIPVFCGPLGQVPQQDVVYRNEGNGKFTDVTRASGMHLETPRFSLGVVTADYDNDGDQDIYVANDSVANSLWKNEGNGKFVDVGLGSLVALNADGRAQAGMGTDFGDYDGDGWLDIVVTNFAHDFNTIYRNLEGRFFMDDSAVTGMSVTHLALSWGTGFVDFDNDGDLELFIANGHIYPQVDEFDLGTSYNQRNHLFVRNGKKFIEVSAKSGPAFEIARSFRGAAFGDYDNDGDMDILVTAVDEGVLLMRNDSRNQGHYLQLRLIGEPSNRDAVGARVTVTAGGRKQVRQRKGGGSFYSASDGRLHFGLGAATRADRVEIVWPSGAKQSLENVAADRLIVVKEGQSGEK